MKIAIANDHRGYQTKLKIKSILEKKGYEIIDIGTDSEKRVDHPVYAFKLRNCNLRYWSWYEYRL